MANFNSPSLYLPIDTTAYPNGWTSYGPYYEIVAPHQTVAHTDSSITFKVQISTDDPALAFGCTLAGANSCTVDNSTATCANSEYPLYLHSPIGPAVGGGSCYTTPFPIYVFDNPIPASRETQILTVKFSNLDLAGGQQLWTPGASEIYGCAFIVFAEFTYPGPGYIAAAYPFNLLSGPSNIQTINLKCNCGCPVC